MTIETWYPLLKIAAGLFAVRLLAWLLLWFQKWTKNLR